VLVALRWRREEQNTRKALPLPHRGPNLAARRVYALTYPWLPSTRTLNPSICDSDTISSKMSPYATAIWLLM